MKLNIDFLHLESIGSEDHATHSEILVASQPVYAVSKVDETKTDYQVGMGNSNSEEIKIEYQTHTPENDSQMYSQAPVSKVDETKTEYQVGLGNSDDTEIKNWCSV